MPSRDRGCKGHRILRKVPDDGRHPGSFSRGGLSRDGRRGGLGGSTFFQEAHEGAPKVRDEERRQGCQRLDRIGAVGRTCPRHRPRWSREEVRSNVDPPKRFGRRETSVSPVKSRGAQTPRGPHAAKVAAGSRKRARYGYSYVVWVAEVVQTHRASCSMGSRKATWGDRALARRNLVASPDVRHERRDGEPVREFNGRP